jgi:hypothetical protein
MPTFCNLGSPFFVFFSEERRRRWIETEGVKLEAAYVKARTLFEDQIVYEDLYGSTQRSARRLAARIRVIKKKHG